MTDIANTQTDKITTIYVTSWCPYCRNVKRWMDTHEVPFESVNIEENEEAALFVQSVNGGNQTVPTVVFPDGSVETNPGAAQLAKKFPQAVTK